MLSVIFELTNLETLVLDGHMESIEVLNQLHKLQKLKRLRVDSFISRNILDHLKFGVFNNLEELDARFYSASVESVGEMRRITPNLKKIVIHSATPETVNAMLETLQSLESVKIRANWNMSEKVYPNIKQLHVNANRFSLNAEQMTKHFPNLEDLQIYGGFMEAPEALFIELLSGWKRLKTLYMQIWTRSEVDSESALRWMQVHGEHLENASIIFGFVDPEFFWIDHVYAIERKTGGTFCIIKNYQIYTTRGYFSI
jgi:hypothetical protein